MPAGYFPPRGPGIATRPFLVVLVMMLLSLTALFLASSHFEAKLLGAVQEQSESSSETLRISVQQLTYGYLAAELPQGVPAENWRPINREDPGIGVVLRVSVPDLEKMKTWKAPLAEKAAP